MDAFCHLAETEGKLGLDALLQPAIHYAEAGVPVAPRVAFDWGPGAAILQGAARAHYLIDGSVPEAGQVFRSAGQAEVLRQIANKGRDAFYSGDIAEDMIAALTQMGGVHTAEDFQTTACTETQPVSGIYGDLELVEHPPNGQGATAILLLNILKNFDLASMDPFGMERLHIEAEASKLAYDARNRFIADPDHTTHTDRFTDQGVADRLAALIDPKRAMPAAAPLTEAIHKDTVYITVVDRDGMAVSLIYSIFSQLWFWDRVRKIRHPAAKPGRGLYPAARSSERDGRRQTSDAHDYPGNDKAKWAHPDAIWRHGWGVSTHRPCPVRLEHERSRVGSSGKYRRTTRLC